MKRCLLFVGLMMLAPSGRAEEPAAAPQDPAAMMKLMEEMAQPSPELQKLAPLVGKWTYTGKFFLDPTKSPMESSGTIERKWILGNRFLHESYEGTNFDGKPGFEGRGVMGYDKGLNAFTSAWICTSCTSISNSKGTSDATGKVLTFTNERYCPIRQKMCKGKNVLHIESDDKVILEGYDLDGGKETKMMEIVSVRQK
jgi:hypothetical protein